MTLNMLSKINHSIQVVSLTGWVKREFFCVFYDTDFFLICSKQSVSAILWTFETKLWLWPRCQKQAWTGIWLILCQALFHLFEHNRIIVRAQNYTIESQFEKNHNYYLKLKTKMDISEMDKRLTGIANKPTFPEILFDIVHEFTVILA